MNVTFEELFEDFKQLEEKDKKVAIIDFLKQNISIMQSLNNQLSNDLSTLDINKIINESPDNHLEIMYQLLHVMTEQLEILTEKITDTFYEDRTE